MKLLYIDHSIVAREARWSDLKDLMDTGRVRLGLSLWNFYEIAGATDADQKERRVAFLLRFKPLWIRERREVQRHEVLTFVARHCFGRDSPKVDATVPYFSMLVSPWTRQNTQIGLTPQQWMATLDMDALAAARRQTPESLLILQRRQSDMRQHEAEIFERWIKKSLPLQAPDGRRLLYQERVELLAYCKDHRTEVLSECPALGVEHALSLARTDDPNRNPVDSDAPDLMHSVVALAYADYYLVDDRYVRRCAQTARRHMPTLKFAEVLKDSASLLAAL
jgi:hypothetical protein